MRAVWKTLARRACCLYPGLPPLWHDGSWLGLALAGSFSVVVNLALLSSFVWSELLAPTGVALCWVGALSLWIGGWWLAVRQGYWTIETTPAEAPPDLLPEAQVEYLRGNWYQAEMVCRKLLMRDDHDAEAHLLLAGVLRRTGRLSEALRQLKWLASLETADPWQFEIARLQDRINEHQQAGTTDTTANLAAGDADGGGPQFRQAA